MPINYAAPAALAAVPAFYTLACDGTIQRITLAKDVDGATLDASGLVNIWADIDSLFFENSNNSPAIVYIAYRKSAAPATLDKTTAMLDLQVGQTQPFPHSLRERRDDQINLKDVYVKGAAGCYLHVIIPRRGTM